MNQRLTERWSELAPLLDQVLEVPAQLRVVWLDERPLDPELKQLLRELLAQDVDAAGFLDGDSGAYAAVLSNDDLAAPALLGRTLGAWQLQRMIGQGGMASVFLAERTDSGFAQRAALKLMRYGVHDRAEQRRFIRERAILARLEHAHIARLIDGGFTPEGVPFFVMEYVEGEPITRYCDTHALDLDARIGLLIAVCDAVQFAHQALVVHRDLKPNNILVAADGMPKLLDFGIARLIEPDADATITAAGQRRLTPAYAAPEQFVDGPITAATDVYALGVLLHELLVGTRPELRDDDTLRALTAALARAQDTPAIAAQRRTTAAALRRRLAGDLSSIVSKALKRTATDRYASVRELADDLHAVLEHRPVAARPDSRRYRAVRFVQRHRLAVAAVLALMFSVAAGVGATVWEAQQTRRAAARANVVQQFVVELFESNRPGEPVAQAPSTEELLDRGAQRAQREFATEPEAQFDMLIAIGRIYRSLGNYDRARPILDRVLVLSVEHFGAHDQRVAEALVEIGTLASEENRFADATRAFDRAGAIETIARPTAETRARTLWRYGTLQQRQRRDAQAELSFSAALQLLPPLPEHAALADEIKTSLAVSRLRLGNLSGAEQLLREALASRRHRWGDDHAEVADTLDPLGVVLRGQGRYAEARAALSDAVAIDRRVYTHPSTKQSTHLSAYGALLRFLGEYDQAERAQSEALAIARSLYREPHANVATALLNSGVVLLDLDRAAEAAPLMQAALDQYLATQGADALSTASAEDVLAEALLRLGRIHQAQLHAARALSIKRGAPGDQRASIAQALVTQAQVDGARHDGVAAEAAAREAVQLISAAVGEDHVRTALHRLVLAEVLCARGSLDQARLEVDRSTRVLRAKLPASHAEIGHAALIGARIATAAGDRAGAARALDEADSILARSLPAAHRWRVEVASLR